MTKACIGCLVLALVLMASPAFAVNSAATASLSLTGGNSLGLAGGGDWCYMGLVGEWYTGGLWRPPASGTGFVWVELRLGKISGSQLRLVVLVANIVKFDGMPQVVGGSYVPNSWDGTGWEISVPNIDLDFPKYVDGVGVFSSTQPAASQPASATQPWDFVGSRTSYPTTGPAELDSFVQKIGFRTLTSVSDPAAEAIAFVDGIVGSSSWRDVVSESGTSGSITAGTSTTQPSNWVGKAMGSWGSGGSGGKVSDLIHLTFDGINDLKYRYPYLFTMIRIFGTGCFLMAFFWYVVDRAMYCFNAVKDEF